MDSFSKAEKHGGTTASNDESASIRVATTVEDLRAIQRFKYEVYVEEMGRYAGVADHQRRLLIEPDDDSSHNFLITVHGELSATMRLTWGGDNALTERHIDQYDLSGFLDHVALDQIVIGERFMIAPVHRGGNLLMDMFTAYVEFVNDRRIQLIFGDCEPHLLNTYQALGFRTYTDRNVNSSETGYLIPLVIVAEDVEYMQRIKSPLAAISKDFGEEARVPANIDALLARGFAVKSQRMDGQELFFSDFKTIAKQTNALDAGLFQGMGEDEIAICLEKSVIITCRPGDRVIKKGNVAKNMAMVLSGTFEVRDGEKTLATIKPGEVFGEIAFFLKLPRTMDVVCAEQEATIVSFNDKTIRTLIESHSEAAATLLYNVSSILCGRLKKTNELL
jgi:hypothetical protein